MSSFEYLCRTMAADVRVLRDMDISIYLVEAAILRTPGSCVFASVEFAVISRASAADKRCHPWAVWSIEKMFV